MRAFPSIAVSAAALSTLAGGARCLAVDFAFTPHCNNNWYQECSFSPACPGGGFPTFNNWGYNNCTGSLPTPGAGDAVHIGGNALVINNGISVASMDETALASINWAAGDITIGSPFQNLGAWSISAGGVHLAATINNSGSITDVSGYTRLFDNSVINNTGTVELQSASWYPGAGNTGQLNSSATVRKTTGSGATLQIGVNNTGGLWDLQQGNTVLSSTTVQSSASTTYNTSNAAGFYLNSDLLSGVFQGTNNGAFQINVATLAADTTFNVQANGLNWSSGDIDLGGHTLINQGNLAVTAGGVNFNGPISNQGYFVDVSGYSRVFHNASITNQAVGTMEWQSVSWLPNSGQTGLFTNYGTVNKTTGSSATLYVDVVNNGAWNIQAGPVSLVNDTVQSSPSASYSVAGGTSLNFNNVLISGTLAGSNSGLVQFNNAWTLAGDLNLNMSGNGVVWSAGDLNTAGHTLINHSPFAITAGGVNFTGTISNFSTLTDVSGYGRVFHNSSILNNPSAVVEWQSAVWQPSSGQTGLFTNNGTVNKTTGSTATMYVDVVNNGPCNVTAGTVVFANDSLQSTNASSYPVASGASLVFNNVLWSGRFAGVNSGSAQAVSVWTLGADTTIDFTGNGLVWSSGDLNTQSHTLTNQGLLSLTAGGVNVTGTILNTSTGTLVDVSGYGRVFHNATITNNGDVEWQSAVWEPSSGQTGMFINNGTVNKTTGSGATMIVDIVNHGPFNLHGGVMTVTGNTWLSTPAASYTVDAGAGITINNILLSGTFNGSNSGQVQANSTWGLAANTTLNLSGNGLVWSGGDLNTGAFTLTNQGVMSITAGGVNFNGAINNTGLFTDISGYTRVFHNSTITNSGTINLQSAAWQPGSGESGTLTSTGTILKTTGSSAAMAVVVNNSGFIDLQTGNTAFTGGLNQTAGETRLDGGAITGGTVTLAGGRLDGNGQLTATVNNTGGTLAPGLPLGAIALSGAYTQGAGGNMEIDLAGTVSGTSFDHLGVTGSAAINGTLTVRFLSGYTPPLGTTFRFLDVSGTRTGTFSNVVLNSQPYSEDVVVTYDAHGATLTIVQRCGKADFNCDGDTGTDADIEAFFSCLAGNCPPAPCTSSADFNYDGDTGTDADIEAFFRVLAGGNC